MKAEDIIEGINTYIDIERSQRNIDNTSYLLLQRSMEVGTIRAYKNYKYTIWLLDNKERVIVKVIEHLGRSVTKKEEESINNILDKELIVFSIELTRSPNMGKIIYGDFKEFNTSQ